jgi:hypothetical protein
MFFPGGIERSHRCLEGGNGKELWQDKYESLGASGQAQSFSGPEVHQRLS